MSGTGVASSKLNYKCRLWVKLVPNWNTAVLGLELHVQNVVPNITICIMMEVEWNGYMWSWFQSRLKLKRVSRTGPSRNYNCRK